VKHTLSFQYLSVKGELGSFSGGFPYPGIRNRELMRLLKRGYRMEKPETCSEEL